MAVAKDNCDISADPHGYVGEGRDMDWFQHPSCDQGSGGGEKKASTLYFYSSKCQTRFTPSGRLQKKSC